MSEPPEPTDSDTKSVCLWCGARGPVPSAPGVTVLFVKMVEDLDDVDPTVRCVPCICASCGASWRGRIVRLGRWLTRRYWWLVSWATAHASGRPAMTRLRVVPEAAGYAAACSGRPTVQLWRALWLCRRYGHLLDGTELDFGGGDAVGEAVGFCARCGEEVPLTAGTVRHLRDSGVAPELFAMLAARGVDPLRVTLRRRERDGEGKLEERDDT